MTRVRARVIRSPLLLEPARMPRSATTDTCSLSDARRLALAAQGFGRPRPARVSARHLEETLRRLALLQLDFVNLVCPSHFIICFSRLGPYQPRLLLDVLYRSGRFTEQWAHEASVIPMETWPLLRDRMENHHARPWGFDEIMRRHHVYVDTVIGEIRDRGPLGASDMPDPAHTTRRMPGSWYGSVPRAVLEAGFGRGRLAVTDRRDNFSRVFDLAERVIPEPHFSTRIDPDDAERKLVRQSVRAHGIGTAADMADYFRIPVPRARRRLDELVEAGTVRRLAVDSWRDVAYADAGAGRPKPVVASALLSPFDPVVWFRPRAARLFGFDFRFEIFIPAAKRRWGCYVLPFLMDDRLVARVDLKADREHGTLTVPGAWGELQTNPDVVVPRLATELQTMASWLGLPRVRVGRRGNLAAPLGLAVRQLSAPRS
jgi:uncharacterized protein